MAKQTIVRWACPDCGRVEETVCSGSVTGRMACRECGRPVDRIPMYYRHQSSGCNGCFEMFVPKLSNICYKKIVCGICGREDSAQHFKRFYPELTLTDTTITTTTTVDMSMGLHRIAVVDSEGNVLAELSAGEQLSFGRGRMADVHLETADPRVSRVHFTLSRDDSGAVKLIVDGRNGLLLNGEVFGTGAMTEVVPGDEIIVYDKRMKLE